MHGHVPEHEFIAGISSFLGGYFLTLAIMNFVASYHLWHSGTAKTLFRIGRFDVTTAFVWLILATFFTLIGAMALGGVPLKFPGLVKDAFDGFFNPITYTLLTGGGLLFLFIFRSFFVQPWVAWAMLNGSLLFMGVAMTDQDFAAIVTKPDNVPIVGMVYLLGFFTWLGAYKAVQNDRRIAQGEPVLEKVDDEKVLVWPDLVYTELICMVALTALLLVWGITLQAPLEEPASAVKTPNPSKAPWYFLGLQEMLVYYDPWMAGVVLPSMVIFGLMAIPFLDFNREGNGYYTINQRKFAYITFEFGFLVLWVMLIVMGTFLRGPNWNFFGPFETWDPHKVEALNNVDLSDYFWVWMLGVSKPKPPEGANALVELGWILYREAPGIILTLGYFLILPPGLVLGSKFFRRLYMKMGFMRYMLMVNLLLIMLLLPIKMACRWMFDLKYFIAISEYFLNF